MRNCSPAVPLAEASITLSGVMRAQPGEAGHLPLASALELSLDVVRLVAAKHDEGRVVGVLDAAHLICRHDGALELGGVGGNPNAPELRRGDQPDRLSDVYALGALMYRLFTGRKVDPDKLIEPPSHLNPAVDSALDELVLEALEEDPSERPYSARALEQRLTEIFDELGLEVGSRADAHQVIRESLSPKKRVAAPMPAPRPYAVLPAVDDDGDDGDDDLAPYRGPLAQFLYDMGWVGRPKPGARRAVALGDEPELSTAERGRRRNRLSQFMYDNSLLQGIDWDSDVTLSWCKRGGIALAVLLLVVVAWPSKKQPRVTAAQAALIAQGEKQAKAQAPAVKATPVASQVAVKPVAKARRR